MATPITITIPHKLGRAEARVRVDEGVGRFASQISGARMAQVEHGWAGDRLSFRAQGLGQVITGRVDVTDTDVRVEVDLPAFLAAIAEKIRGKVEKQGRLLLEKK